MRLAISCDIWRSLAVYSHLSSSLIGDGDSSGVYSNMARERKSRTVAAVVYGTFDLEETSMPIYVPDISNISLRSVSKGVEYLKDHWSHIGDVAPPIQQRCTHHWVLLSISRQRSVSCKAIILDTEGTSIAETRVCSHIFRIFFGRDL